MVPGSGFLGDCPIFDEGGGVALVDAEGLKDARGDRASSQDCVGPHFHSGGDPTSGSEPSAVIHHDGPDDQVEGFRFVIVIAGAKEGTL